MMKTKTLLLSLTTALAISAAAPAASALQTEFIATGTVGNSYDNNGIFGPSGSSLAGDSFTATAYIDTSLGTLTTQSGYNDNLLGGTLTNTSNPVFELLTINGVTYSFGPTSPGYYQGSALIAGYDPGYSEEVMSYYQGLTSDMEIFAYGGSLSVPSNFGQSFYASSGTTPFLSSSSFQIFTQDGSQYEASGYLDVTTISSPGVVDFTSSAPEPSTWALLIAGVGVIGGALRFGRRSGALATV